MRDPTAATLERNRRFGRLAAVFWLASCVPLSFWLWAGLLTPAPIALVAAFGLASGLLSHPTSRHWLAASAFAGPVVALGVLAAPLLSPYGYAVDWPNIAGALLAIGASTYSLIGLTAGTPSGVVNKSQSK